MKSLKPVLAALVEATKVAEYTPLLEADRLTAFRALFTHEAVLRFVVGLSRTGQISSFQHPGDGIGDGQHQTAVLKNRMLPTDAF